MAITLTALPTPTNLGATAVAGGSLDASTTYYYKIVACDADRSFSRSMESPHSAEFSAITTDTNKQIDLTWDAVAGATHYVVLRTTVTGDYNDKVGHAIRNAGGSYDYATTNTNSLSDANTRGSLNRFWYRPAGVPLIKVDGGTVGTPLTMEDIYDADVAGGWNRVIKPQFNNDLSYDHAKDLMSFYMIDANLHMGYISNTWFESLSEHIVAMGRFFAGGAYIQRFQMGESGDNKFTGSILEVRCRPLGTYCNLSGEIYLYDSHFHDGSRSQDMAFSSSTWAISGFTLSAKEVIGCRFSNWIQINKLGNWDTGKYNTIDGVYDGLSFGNSKLLVKDITIHNAIHGIVPWYSSNDGMVYQNITTAESCNWDMYANGWAANAGETYYFRDCVFEARDYSENDNPFMMLAFTFYTHSMTFVFDHAFNLKVVDSTGTGIASATVAISDKDGNVLAGSPFTTDANGDISEQILKDFSFVGGVALDGLGKQYDYYEGHRDNGYLVETKYSPWTVTITATGYSPRTVKYTMDRKREEIEKLTADGTSLQDVVLHTATIY